MLAAGCESPSGDPRHHHVGVSPETVHWGYFSKDRAPVGSVIVDSIPPSYFGGNIDDWRIGAGATMYYPVSVPGALLSAGDPHAAQGDSELDGTAIETSLTGTFQVILHKKDALAGTIVADLIRCWRPSRRGLSTASATPTICESWVTTPDPRSTPSRPSTRPCGMPSARCVTSS